MSILIRDATVITMDAAATIHAPGAVLVEGTRITAAGPSDEVASRAPPGCEVVEGNGRLVLPGFVSAHNHLGYTVFRGRAEDLGHSPTHRLYLPMSMVMRRDEREAFGSLAIAELLRGGVTTVLEMEEDADVLAPFIERSGIRAGIGLMTHDVDLERLMNGDTVFDPGVRRRATRCRGRIRADVEWRRRRSHQHADHHERTVDLVARSAEGAARRRRPAGAAPVDPSRER